MNQRVIKSIFLFHLLGLAVIWFVANQTVLMAGFNSSLLALARLAGLIGGFLLLVQFLLASRTAPLERAFGLDKIFAIHRRHGNWAYGLLLTHFLLIVTSYSQLNQVPLPEQVKFFLENIPQVTLALIGFALLTFTVVLSVSIVRRNLRYESWYFVHLLNYVVLALILWHQIELGQTLNSYAWLKAYWIGLYAIVVLNLVIYRFGRPAYLYYKHRFVVEKVERETPDVVSIYISGRNLGDFKWRGGQFNFWYIFASGLWWQKHPFTISIEPNGRHLRISAKAVGDFTAKLPSVKPGTRVLVDGPYGRFTREAASQDNLLLIAGGIGITPLRAMIGGLAKAQSNKSVTLLYTAYNPEDLALKGEIEQFQNRLDLTTHYFITNQTQAENPEPGFNYQYINLETIQNFAPEYRESDIYICGPPGMIEDLTRALKDDGFPATQIHSELFEL